MRPGRVVASSSITPGHRSPPWRLLQFTVFSVLIAVGMLYADPLLGKFVRVSTEGWTVRLLGKAWTGPPGEDSTGFMRRAEAAFDAPTHRIYADLFFKQHEKFIYPPSALLLTEALSHAPAIHMTAASALKAMLLFSWMGTLVMGVLTYRDLRGGVSLVEVVCVLLLGLLFMPFTVALVSGQVQTILMFLWGAAVWLWVRKHTGSSGAVLALSCLFKPQMAVFLLWGVLRREWRFTSAFLAVVSLIEGLSVARFGLQNQIDYLSVLRYLSGHGEAGVQNQSVAGLMNRLLRNGDALHWYDDVYPPFRTSIYVATMGFAAIATVAALVVPWLRRWQSTAADMICFGCVATVVSPIVWRHHYSVLYFAIMYLLARAEHMPRWQWLATFAAAVAIGNYLPPLDHFYGGPLSLLGNYVFYAGLLVLVSIALNSDREVTRTVST